MQSGHISNFKHLSQFSSLKEFNNNIEAFLAVHKNDFTRSELYCFKALTRFAVKVKGISNISINKLLKAISEQFKSVSESTFHRMKRKSIRLGILAVHSTKRSNGSQSSNIWVFNKWLNVKNDIPQVNTDKVSMAINQGLDENGFDIPFKASKPSKTNNQLNNTYHTESLNFYGQFKNFLHSTIGDNQKLISKLYGVYLGQTRLLFKHEVFDKQTLENVGYDALKTAVMATKSRKIKNLAGFFNGVLDRKLTRLTHEEAERGMEEEASLERESKKSNAGRDIALPYGCYQIN
ncbi:hypothetical protein [Domibacillus enclensis]|uniref:Uncharacterized protein n=1 Tax=Domibacillus enclensis TaxID=1017273 RepID=A0A1N6NUS9_9BACI|nr:hypothetical protein [Domibacillus enclensis]OXS80150.1 hypothetical protein B1B05_01330 [Domibacillus enclensis]SIP95854.1 hypothetical protein SAMN05443094_101281 [Domibacillus enclensis]